MRKFRHYILGLLLSLSYFGITAEAATFNVDCVSNKYPHKTVRLYFSPDQKKLIFDRNHGFSEYDFFRMDWGQYWQPWIPGQEDYVPFRTNARGGITINVFIERALLTDDRHELRCEEEFPYYSVRGSNSGWR